MPAPGTSKGSDLLDTACTSAFAVVPSDVTVFGAGGQPRALYIGGAGNVAVTMSDGSSVTFTAVPVGAILPLNVIQVRATGTTATNIVGMI